MAHKRKSNRSARKRFRLTATGKIKRAHAFKNHILTKKRARRKARLVKPGYVEPCDAGRIERLLVLK
ncbi:MAG: 50S ribosomal protein L35 [Leptospiraceae bacterium]|nr:50S ribosomal protein L35 [Leptospiraceae bacterium]MDW8306494.1 50S ribosomal protein L35 [Leptospiraceae bacterium]